MPPNSLLPINIVPREIAHCTLLVNPRTVHRSPANVLPHPSPETTGTILEPWQYGMFPAATPLNENQFASADESSFSSMSGSEDDLTEDEDDDDVVGYNTETSRHTTVGERNRRRNRGRRRTARRARRDRHATRNNRNPKFWTSPYSRIPKRTTLSRIMIGEIKYKGTSVGGSRKPRSGSPSSPLSRVPPRIWRWAIMTVP